MNKLVSKNPILRFKEGKKIFYYLAGSPKGGIKDVSHLGYKTPELVNTINNREKQLAKHHFSSIKNSEGIWDAIKHVGRGIQHAYNGWVDPATTYQTGIAPTPSFTKGAITNITSKLGLVGKKISNVSDVSIVGVPRNLVPEGERITFFKQPDGTKILKYFDKKFNKWIEVFDDTPDVKVVGVLKTSKPTFRTNNSSNDVLIVNESNSYIPEYNYNNDVQIINSSFDDAYNYDPGLFDFFKNGGQLSSKNPVLRFKQGRKIEKFLEGGFTYNGKKYVGGGTKIVNWIGNLFSNSLNLLRVGMNGKPIVDSVSSQLNTNNNSNTKNYIPVEGVQAMRLKYLGKSNMDVAKEETHNYLEGLRNKYSRPFLKNNPSVKITTPVDNYYLKGFENRKDEIAKLGGVRAVLKMLGFTSGNGLDGKWGQNTEDAYLKYLIANAAKTPSLEDTISVAQNLPILSTPTINPSEYTFTESQLSGLGENPYYEPHPELRFNNFDRTQTRQWLRDNGFNPYSLTGALRKALRMILNGQGTDEDKNLIGLTNGLSEILTNYKYLKQGGSMITLPSRNIVERFKLGRKLLFAQNGSYVPVKVGKNIYQYNPYNKTYKGTQSSGENIKYEDIKNAFNLQYESIGTGNEALYRKKGSRTTWMNSKGKYVDKSLKKLIPVDNGSSEVDRFAIASKKGETRYFKTKEAAKAYQRTLPQGSSVFRDNVEEARGQVLKANRTSEKATEYGRKLLEKNNNLSFKLAYQAARKEGNKFFAYKGKVYKSDLENGKDNRLEMEQHYGDYLGFQKNPNLLNNPSREARKEYRKGIGTDTNRNANYKGETNSQGNARADKNFNRKLGVSTLAPDFIDAVSPQTAIGNFMNMAGSAMTGEHFTPRIYLNGFNVPGYASDLALGKYKDLVFRGLDAWLSTGAPGARINMTPGGTNVTKGTTLLPNGTRTFSKWHLNALGSNAEKIGNNILRSSKGTQYYIDNGQYMKNFEIPALLSNPFILQTQNLEK